MFSSVFFPHCARTVRVWLKRDSGQYWPSIYHTMPGETHILTHFMILGSHDLLFFFRLVQTLDAFGPIYAKDVKENVKKSVKRSQTFI